MSINKSKKYSSFKLQASSFRLLGYGLQHVACGILFTFLFLIHSFAQQEFLYDSKAKRDPFIPLVTSDGRLLKLEQEEGVKGLLLEGIIYDKNGLSCAIVNGEVVKIGDWAGDYQVLKIEKNKIIFIKEGQMTELELKKEE
jgi:hypothetical protein